MFCWYGMPWPLRLVFVEVCHEEDNTHGEGEAKLLHWCCVLMWLQSGRAPPPPMASCGQGSGLATNVAQYGSSTEVAVVHGRQFEGMGGMSRMSKFSKSAPCRATASVSVSALATASVCLWTCVCGWGGRSSGAEGGDVGPEKAGRASGPVLPNRHTCAPTGSPNASGCVRLGCNAVTAGCCVRFSMGAAVTGKFNLPSCQTRGITDAE